MMLKKKKTCSIGINDVDTPIFNNGKKCPYYSVWQGILNRCYRDKRKGYNGCSVCEEWLTFSNFKKWMEKQEWEGKDLDKDLLVFGNKVYSPDTCCFIDHRVNMLLLKRTKTRSLPVGVYKNHDRFRARCSLSKTNKKTIGNFKTVKEARKAYIDFKKDLITEIADDISDKKISDALYKYAKMLTDS